MSSLIGSYSDQVVPNSLIGMPNEILQEIVGYLPIKEQRKVASVCTVFNNTVLASVSHEINRSALPLICIGITSHNFTEFFNRYGDNLLHINLSNISLSREHLDLLLTKIKPNANKESVLSINLNDQKLLSDRHLVQIAESCPNLRDLNISRNEMVGEGLQVLAEKCQNLESLNLFDCALFLDTPVEYRALKKLNLRALKVMCDEIPDLINGSSSLESLDVGGVTLTPLIIQAISQRGGTLKKLLMGHCKNLTDLILEEIVKSCPHLTHLDLNGNEHITDRSASTIPQYCPNLEYLNISNCNGLRDEGIKKLAQNGSKLSTLDISANCNLSDKAIEAVFQNCSHLKNLDISYLTVLTEMSVTHLAQCSELVNLNLYYCFELTENVVQKLSEGACSRLKNLKLSAIKYEGISPETEQRISILRATGVDVELAWF